MSLQTRGKRKTPPWLILFCLIFAGETICGLPFHIARFFRPTLLSVFNLTHTELGDAFAIYGIMAMLAHFPGGVIADRFSPRKLMASSLLLTGIGGLYMAQIPSYKGFSVLFGFWGVTTILLCWAPMLKATREWGGSSKQGLAFGILDGGRGLVAAVFASVGVWILSQMLPVELTVATGSESLKALKAVIYFYTLITFGAAILILLFIPESSESSPRKINTPTLEGIREVLVNPVVWLQAVIIICAYCGYKGLDFYGLYAMEALNMNEVSAATFVSNAAYLRVVTAIAAGFLVDRFSWRKVIGYMFLILLTSYLLLGILIPSRVAIGLIYANLIITFIGVYGIRGVYFALIEETNINRNLTGKAVGIISVVGFTPDIFFASISGRILDAWPGIEGYHHFFFLLSCFAVVGMIAALALFRFTPTTAKSLEDIQTDKTPGSE